MSLFKIVKMLPIDSLCEPRRNCLYLESVQGPILDRPMYVADRYLCQVPVCIINERSDI